MPDAFKIENDQDEIVLRFKRSLVNPSTLARLLDYVELSSIRDASQLTNEQARTVAAEIDTSVWEQVKEKYTG